MIDNVTSSTTFQRAEHQTKPARRFIQKFLNDWSLDLASMLAYSFLVAILPIVITILGFIGLVLKDRPDAEQDLKNKIINSFPADNTTQTGIKQVVDLAFDQLSNDAGVVFATGIIFAMFGSARLFIAIDKCMTIIYRLPERSFLRQYLMALGALFLFIIIIAMMLAASSVPSGLMNTVQNGGGRFGIFILGILISLSIAFGLFEIIYWLTPNKKMTFKKTWCGALVAAIILEIFIILFPLYVRQCMSNYAGQIGFAVILILFFYYFAIILIIGAQINAHFFEKYPPFDSPLGTYLSQIHGEHDDGNTKDPSHNDNSEQHSSTTTDGDQHHQDGWKNKLWPFKKRHSVAPQLEENKNV